ncbi:hypothetical protein MHYP_G00231930 [Metynnis hypsauchen]
MHDEILGAAGASRNVVLGAEYRVTRGSAGRAAIRIELVSGNSSIRGRSACAIGALIGRLFTERYAIGRCPCHSSVLWAGSLVVAAPQTGTAEKFSLRSPAVVYRHAARQETTMAPWIGLILMAIAVFSKRAEGKRDEVLYCSACVAIADELRYSISQIDPKKTVNVGGFRLNPDGSMTEKTVPLARSETHLSELLDGVCNNMSDYALYEDPDTKEQSYKRFAPRSSDAVNFPDFKNFKFAGPEGSESLKFACETIVEELEEDIISLFTREEERVALKLCSEVSGHCKSSVFQHGEL